MKKIIFTLLLSYFSFSIYSQNVTISGKILLQNNTIHDSIKIVFERTAPSSLNYTTFSDTAGNYSISVQNGIYNVTFQKDNYFHTLLKNNTFYANKVLSDTSLTPHTTLIKIPQLFSSIQVAIDVSYTGDTILVDTGIYYENLTTAKKVILISNYFYSENDSDIINTVIDGSSNGRVISFLQYSSGCLNGFTVRNGSATGSYPNSFGGGIYIDMSSPLIINCVITNNSAYNRGGGIYANYTQSKIINCKIISNYGGYGGGISVGGGWDQVMNITNCEIINNTAGGNGIGGINCEGNAKPIIENSIIYGNSGGDGGGVFCDYSSAAEIINCAIVNNTGYGIHTRANSSSYSTAITKIRNTIIEGNSGSGIYFYYNPTVSITYSNVYNNTGGNFTGNIPAYVGQIITINSNGDSCDMFYNIFKDSKFINTTTHNYHLTYSSSCIDAGNNSYPINGYDFENNFRIWDGDSNNTPIVDMGPYEYASVPYTNSPVIYKQPNILTKSIQDTALFYIKSTGDSLSFQWQKNNSNISGATNDTFIIYGVQISDMGNYRCIVSNSYGADTSNNAFLTVLMPDSLVAYYPFNNNANDESGNGNHGTIVGTITSTTDRFGNAKKAYYFDGDTGYISIPSLDSLPYTPITYSAWVIVKSYFPFSAGHKFRSIIGRNTSFVTTNGVIGFYADSNVAVGAYDNTFTMWRGGGNTGAAPYSVTIPPLNTWCHIAYTQSASGDWKWYFNGTLTNSGNFTDTQNDFNYFRIGGCNNFHGYHWNDKLDDILVYNRVLSLSEIRNLYQAPPEIIDHPNSESIPIGDTALFQVYAIGSDTLTYQWQKNNSNISGATNDTFVINGVQTSDVGNYRCIVSNNYSADTSNNAYLIVLTLDSGLVAYYPFTGNAGDSSGNGNHGTAYGPTLTSDRFANSNNAYSFDGINDTINVNHSSSFNFSQNKQSIAFWLKIDSFPANNKWQILIDKMSGSQSSYTGFQVQIQNLSGDTSLMYRFINGNNIWGHISIKPKDLPLNQYNFITFTTDGSVICAYVNGKQVSSVSVTTSAAIGANTSKMFFGHSWWHLKTYLEYFKGVLDDVRIYNRTLTQYEISQLYDSFNSPTITSFSPASGSLGTLVTVTGTNLNNLDSLSIGGTNAIVVSNSDTTLVGLVMPGAVTGTVSVSTSTGTATSISNFTVILTPYPSTQQGSKLVGTGTIGIARQGCSVSISADGNTAIVGGNFNNNYIGAAWLYTRSNGVWSQQGSKLVGTGAVGNAYQGYSVSISADGNTAIVGGGLDNNNAGAVWVFIRSNGVWSQQGSKLVGTGAVGKAVQGYSVSISADGNTAIVGGVYDNNYLGAAWVYTRSNGIWSQQGSKLVGTGAVGNSRQGCSVSISADGNTAIVGGISDDNFIGAAWVFTRSNGVWSQQGSKLVGTGAVGNAVQGHSVSISADGNTAIVGGYNDNNHIGAAWIYTRTSGVWSQQGSKLVGTGTIGDSYQGYSVSISADGNTAIVGGEGDNNNAGAVWVYTRSSGVWSQQGSKLVGTGVVGNAYQGYDVSISADGNTAIIGGLKDNNDIGAAWIFIPGSMPTITSNPTSHVNCFGDSVLFNISATGDSLTYQWQKDNSNISGANDSIYTIYGVNLSDTGYYKCIVSNSSGSDTSSNAKLTVDHPVSGLTINDNTQCLSGNSFSFTNSSTGASTYNWIYGDGNSSSQSSPTYSYVSSGSFTVKLVVTSSNGCKDSTIQNMTVYTQPTADYSIYNATQCLSGNNFSFSNSSSGSSTYVWNFGDNSTSTSSSPSKTYTTANTFAVKLVTTSSDGCKDSVTKSVMVYPQPTANFTINNATQCLSGNNFSFTNSSSGGSTYAWNFGDNSTSTSASPSKSYTTANTFSVKLVTTSSNGCKDSVTKSVTVYPQPTANFTINNNAQCLSGNNFSFTNSSSGGSTYAWNFGDNSTSTNASPSKTYTTANTFSVKLVTTSSDGCKDSVTKSVTVYPQPTANFTINNATQCLSGNSFNFSDGSSVSTGSLAGWSWTFGDGNSSTNQSPSGKSYATAGTYSVKLVATTNNGCKDSLTKTVTVHPQPTAGFTINNSAQCLSGNSFNFSDGSSVSTGSIAGWNWMFGDGNTSTNQNPTGKSYSTPGTYSVKLVTTTNNGCKDSLTKTVTVYPQPTASFTINNSAQCLSGNSFNFSDGSSVSTGNITTWNWTFGDGNSSTNQNPIGKSYASPGTYTVKLLSTSNNGCKDSVTNTVKVYPHPVTVFSINDTDQCFRGNNFALTNSSSISSGTFTNLWDFGDNSTSANTNPSHTFAVSDQTFDIKLVTTSAFGCSDSLIKKVLVLPHPQTAFSINDTDQCFRGNNFILANSSSISSGSYNNLWDFGDNSTSANTSPSHTFATSDQVFDIKLVTTSTFGCSDSLTKKVVVLPHPQTVFSINDTDQCFRGNNFILANSSSISSGSYNNFWDFGDNSTSANTNPSHTFATSDQVFAIKLVTTSAFGCKDSLTKKVVVLPHPQTVFSINDTDQCFRGNNFILANSSSISSGTYNNFWDFGDDSTCTCTSPIHTFATSDQVFDIKLVTTSAFGCMDSLTKKVVVLPHPQTVFSINDTDQCFRRNYFTYYNTSSISSGTYSSFWTFGDTSTCECSSPSYAYFTSDQTFDVKLVTTSAYGCKDSLTKQVVVLPHPQTDFSINDTDQCYRGNNFNLTNTSSISSGSFANLWDFGDNSTSANTNPSHTFAASDQVFDIKLLTTSAFGCKDSVIKQVVVLPHPITDFTINNSYQCFRGNDFIFSNSSAISSGSFNNLWDFGDYSTSTNLNPAHNYTITDQEFDVKLLTTSGFGCQDSLTKKVTVFPHPHAEFSINDTDQCFRGNSFAFADSSSIPSGSFSIYWDLGDGANTSLASFAYSYLYYDTTFSVQLKAISIYGCADSLSKRVYVYYSPDATFDINDDVQCLNENEFIFTGTDKNVSLHNWNFGNYQYSTKPGDTITYASPGYYAVDHGVMTAKGCSDSLKKNVRVDPSPDASFTFNYHSNAKVKFYSVVDYQNQYSWKFGDGYTSPSISPSHRYKSNGSFYVELKVENPYNCLSFGYDTVIVSNCTGIDEISELADFQIFPNPTHGIVNIINNSSEDRYIFTLQTMQGEILLREEISLIDYQLNISNVAKGVYLLRIETERGVLLRKVVLI